MRFVGRRVTAKYRNYAKRGFEQEVTERTEGSGKHRHGNHARLFPDLLLRVTPRRRSPAIKESSPYPCISPLVSRSVEAAKCGATPPRIKETENKMPGIKSPRGRWGENQPKETYTAAATRHPRANQEQITAPRFIRCREAG